MSEIEVGPQSEEHRTDIIYSREVQMPTSHGSLSSHETDNVGGSPVRPCVTDIIPQLDGPTSVHAKRTATMPRGRYSHDEQRHSERRRHYHDRGGRPPDRGNDQERGYSRSGRSPDKGPPADGGPPTDGGPPDDGGPLEMEDIQDDLEDKDHQAHKDLLDQCVLS